MPQTGRGMIFDERARQEAEEGYNDRHDSEWIHGELADAAIAYLLHGRNYKHQLPNFWPWDIAVFKPKDRIKNLVRAGALIAAEIDRLQSSFYCPECGEPFNGSGGCSNLDCTHSVYPR